MARRVSVHRAPIHQVPGHQVPGHLAWICLAFLAGCATVPVHDGAETRDVPPENLAVAMAQNYTGAALVFGGALFDLVTLPVRAVAAGGVDNVQAGPGSGSLGARVADRGLALHRSSVRLIGGREYARLARDPAYAPVRIQAAAPYGIRSPGRWATRQPAPQRGIPPTTPATGHRIPQIPPPATGPRPQDYFADRCLLNSRTGDLVCQKTQIS